MRFELLFSSVSHRKKPERIPTFPRKARTIPHTPFMLRADAKTDPPTRTRRLGLSCRSDALPRPHERGNGCGTVAGRLRAKGRPVPSSGTGPRSEERLGTGDGARHIVFEGTTAASARRRTSRRQPFGNRATCARSYRMATLPPETNRRRPVAAPDGATGRFKVPSPCGTPSRADRRERHVARRLGLSLPNTIHSSGTPRS